MYINLPVAYKINPNNIGKDLKCFAPAHINAMMKPEFKVSKNYIGEIPNFFGITEFLFVEPTSKDIKEYLTNEILSALNLASKNVKVNLPVLAKKIITTPLLYDGYFSHRMINLCLNSEMQFGVPMNIINLKVLLNSIGINADIINVASRLTHIAKINNSFQKDFSENYEIISNIKICGINNNYKERGIFSIKNRIQRLE